MDNTTRILIVEDDINDYDLAQVEILRVLKDCTFIRVDKENNLLPTLQEFRPHIILSDYKLPGFDGGKVLELARQHASLTPVIIWTGAVGEDIAIDCMKMGASDYVLKENTRQLGHAVIQALKERDVLLERKQAQEKYRAIFENSPIGIFQSTPQGQFLSVNPAMARIYGYASPQEMISSITDIAHQIYTTPEDRLAFINLLETQHVVENFERENTRKDGSVFWTSTSARAVYDEAGNISYYEGFLQDITDRKMTDARLRESEARYHGIFENAQDAIFVETFEGDILDVNQRACDMFGYTRQEFLQKKVKDIIPAHGQPVYLPSDSSSLGKTIEAVNVRANGEHFPVELRGGLFEARGRRLLLIILRDITERKQAEEKLREQDKRFRVLIENGMDNISLLAKDGTLLWENPAVYRTLGYETGYFIGRDIFQLMHPEDRGWTSELFAKLVHTSGEVQHATFRLQHFDGSWHWIEATATNMLDEPSVKAVVINYRDITQRKQAEKALRDSESKYRTLAENSLQGIAIYQGQKIVYANPAMSHINGYTVEELMDMSADQIVALTHPEDRVMAQERAVKRSAGEPLSPDFEGRILRKDGTIVWLHSFNNPIEFDGKPALLSTMIDITQRKQAERERQALLEIMQGLANTKDLQEFLELVHHSLGNVIYAENFFVVLYQQESMLFEEIYSVDQYDPPAPPSRLEKSITSYVFRSGEPLLLTQEGFEELVEQGEIELVGTDSASWLGVPLKTSKGTIGVIAVQDYQDPNRYSNHDKDFLASIASQIALVVERKQAETSLMESMAQFQALFEASPDAILLINPNDWSIVDCNTATCEMNGYRREELIGQCIDILNTTPGDPNERAEYMERIRQQGILHYETIHRRRDGTLITVDVSTSMIELGKRNLILGIDRDITERKRADVELKQKNDDLALLNAVNQAVVRGQNLDSIMQLLAEGMRHIFSTVGTTIYMLAPDKQSLVMQQYAFSPEIAQRVEKLLGFSIPRIEIPIKEGGHFHKVMISRRSAITTDPQAIQNWIAEFAETKFLPPITKPIVRKLIPRLYKLLDIKSTIIVPLIFEEEILGFLDVSSPSLFTSNDLKRVESIGEQLTAVIQRQQANEKIRESEERFRLLFENSGEAVLITQPDGSISSANPEACRMFSRSEEEIRSLGRAGIIDPNDPRLALALEERARTGKFKGELNLLRNDGSIFPGDVSTTIFRDSGGNEKTSMIIRDITERRRAEAAEREQRVLAEALRDTSQILSSSLDYGEVLDHILTAVGSVVPHDAATIMLIDGGVARVVRSQGYQSRDPNMNVMDARLPLAETTNLRQMLETKQPVVVHDTFTFPGWNRSVTTHWQRSNVGAPILIHDEVIGFILLDSQTPGYFTPVHAERLEAFANQAALAIHNANLLKQAQAEITERKRAEESLMAERKKLQDYLDIAGVMMLALDRQGTVALINQKGCEILGYSADEVIGKNWIETFVPAEIRPDLLGVFESLSVGDTASSSYYENPVLTKNGEQRMIAWHNTLLRDAQGTVISTLSSGEDITERKQIEAKLQASESRYRLATQATKDVIWEWNADTNQLLWTENAQIVLGYSPEEVGPDALWWDEHIHPEDRERVQSKLYALTALESDESVWLDEYRFLVKDGSYAYINDHAYIERDSSGKAIRMIGAMSNITERKRAEEALRESEALYRRAIEVAGAVPYYQTYYDNGRSIKFDFIGEGIRQITGYAPEEFTSEVWDSLAEEVNLVEDLAGYSLDEGIQRVRSGEKPVWKCEYRIRARDGKIHWVFEAAVELRDEHGVARGSIGTFQDITTRKQAEAELRASEERFRQLATNIEEAFWMTDAQTGQELYISPAAAAIWGNSVENIMNEPDAFINSVAAEDREFVLATLERQRKGEKTEIEYRVQRSDGSIRWVWDRAFPIFDESGKVKMLAGIAADITERKQAEERLRASEERYHSLFQHLVDGFALHEIITDDQGKPIDYRFLEINPAFEKLTGLRAETTIGRCVNEILPKVGNERFISIYGKVALTGEPIHFEEYSAPLGRYYEINAYSPRHRHFAVTFEDITERKQAEADLRKLSRAVEQSASTIIITDIAGNIEYVNPKFTEITGYTFEDVVGGNPRILKSGHTSPDEYKQLWETITAGKEWRGELHNRKKNGDLFWELATISPIQNEHGEITHFLAVKEDISQLKQNEIETRRRADEFAALYETARDLAVQFNLPTLLKTIVERACDLLRVPGGGLYLYDEARNDLEMVLAVGSSVPIGARLKMGEGIAGRVAQTQQLLMVDDYHTWEGRSLQYEAIPFRAVLQVPMLYGGDLIGVLSVNELGNSERKYTEVDAHLLSLFAEYAASAVHAARLLQETQRRLVELEALYENGLAVGQLLEPRQIGERLIETFARHLSWHHVTIRLLRPKTDELELIAFNLPDLDNIDSSAVEERFKRLIHKVGQGLSGYAVQTAASIRTGQVHTHPQYISTQAGIESGLYMPLKIGSRVIGVISVESEKPDAFSEQDERLLATLATQAAIAFENARLYQAAQQEITERERAQAALRESEAHYRELADSITEIMFELDQDLNYSHWNKASELFSGITAQEAIGRSIPDLFGESEDQSYREKIYRRVLTEQQAQTFETEVFPQNQRRILEINAYPSARGVSVVARDITERRLSEALQQKRIALMEYSARHPLDNVMQRAIDEISELTDSHIGFLHFVETDQKAIHMQAWSSETIQLVGEIEERGMHYPVESAGIWADAIRQRQPVIHNDYASLPDKKGLPEGHAPLIRELVVPIIRDDRIAAVLGIGNRPRPYDEHDVEITERFADYAWDIIERKQMESALSDERNQLAKRVEERTADLSRANSNLARALRVKDEFLANMSHELRTPLNAILGLSESLSEQVAGPLNEKQQKYLNTINESGHHLLSLINDILDLAKIEAGQISLDINKVDINSVCQASLRMIKQLAQKKNQEVLFEIDNGLGLMWADERRLKQMIVNLLSNAVKFTPENSRLGLEVHGDEAGNRILITVWDRGIGISGPDLERLFKPFVQLDAGLAREATGTGLGLALVAQMARLHGGSVTVDSHVGEGSRFTIQLPWEPALAGDVSSRLRTSGKFRAIDIHAKKKPTILLVEDTREVVMMLVDYLEMAGFTIATAQDGIEGLEQAKLKHPDLILMDIQMPRMDGFETTQKLRMIPEFKETPIIALTALAMPNDRQRCLDAGMSEYMSKPVNLKMLLKLIRGILSEKEGNPT